MSERVGFAFFGSGWVTLTLSTAHAKLSEPVAHGTEIVFGVDDVNQAQAALSDLGIEFLAAPRDVTSGPPTSYI